MDYALIDSGHQKKLERFGDLLLVRPCAQALWSPRDEAAWKSASATFDRDSGWVESRHLPAEWNVSIEGLKLKLKRTDFGHLGIFPEQIPLWRWIQAETAKRASPKVLNLFAYSGGSTLAAASAGGHVCHLDAAKGMVTWARENAAVSGLEKAPIRWIVDDASKFLAREIRRGVKYDAIILDPPTFGRGAQGEVFKIEDHLPALLDQCVSLLVDNPLYFLLSCHTPGFTPIVLEQILGDYFKGTLESGEMQLSGPCIIPSGCYARWSHG